MPFLEVGYFVGSEADDLPIHIVIVFTEPARGVRDLQRRLREPKRKSVVSADPDIFEVREKETLFRNDRIAIESYDGSASLKPQSG